LQSFPSNANPPSTPIRPGATQNLAPLTRREFYKLAEYCREYALELARYDQTRVNLHQCHKFNSWLPQLKGYAHLAPFLQTMKPARPITRWQILALAIVVGLILLAALGASSSQLWRSTFFYSYLAALFVFYFMPERLYGTTIELIEGKVLRVVDALEALLHSGDLDFTEAAYFQAKENLHIARRELRQQIDLAHR
jgi:hypothetical protein